MKYLALSYPFGYSVYFRNTATFSLKLRRKK